MCARGPRLTVVLGDPGVPGNGGSARAISPTVRAQAENVSADAILDELLAAVPIP